MNHLPLLFASKINVLSAVLVLLLSSSMGFGQDICPGADVVVSAEGMSYSPAALIVDVGTTVGWVNYGGYHDVNGMISSITQIPFYNPESFYLSHVDGTEAGVYRDAHIYDSWSLLL